VTCSSAKGQLRANSRCKGVLLSRTFGYMNGALTYVAATMHQSELRAAAERSRRLPGRPPRKRRLAVLPRTRRARRAYA